MDENINETNSDLKNYFKQRNLGFINNSNNIKSVVSGKGLRFKEQGNSKLAKNFIEYVY